MARRRRRTVYGEPVEVLLDALNSLDPVEADDAAETAAPSSLSEPQLHALVRALMRFEARLLRKDADRFPALDRSTDERRSVALVLLAADVFTTARRLGLAGHTTRAWAEGKQVTSADGSEHPLRPGEVGDAAAEPAGVVSPRRAGGPRTRT